MRTLILIAALALPGAALAGHPECSGVDNWASNMAFAHLKNAGITDNAKVIWKQRKVVRLASEQIGKDLYRQVHRVTFPEWRRTH
jgi:ethanolamine ammonia-lyase large subunit